MDQMAMADDLPQATVGRVQQMNARNVVYRQECAAQWRTELARWAQVAGDYDDKDWQPPALAPGPPHPLMINFPPGTHPNGPSAPIDVAEVRCQRIIHI